ncbi:UDP-N-acetylmuramyl pentapeptide phosphotransferase/UDP-N-acetylglucosamine-1-phosphate transferase [Marisediminicola sp. UYEF4]|uniref:UDP-phosphate glycosyltransferase n=1 Tax=Marisediminicola sp. UYEF4 TaxID=1756384 RepID=UPI003395CBA9
MLLYSSADSPDEALLLLLVAMPATAGILGLTEDLRGLPVYARAIAQILIGSAGAVTVVALTGADWWLVPLGAIAIAAYINVANFMDGINAISSLHGAVVGGAYAALGMLVNLPWLTACGLLLSAAFIAFLPWNLLSRGGMFLGDVGSYLLGAAIAIIAVAAIAGGTSLGAVAGPLVIYIVDVGSTLLRRIRRGERWAEAHRTHVYQRLTSSGLSHVQATCAVTGATILTASLGLLTLNVDFLLPAAIGMVGVATAYLLLPSLLNALTRSKASERT